MSPWELRYPHLTRPGAGFFFAGTATGTGAQGAPQKPSDSKTLQE
jgi:hypothetical protein